jgi:hypothetical protein
MHQRLHVNAWRMKLKAGGAGNFAELGIPGRWLSLPELLKIFCHRNFSIRRQSPRTRET